MYMHVPVMAMMAVLFLNILNHYGCAIYKPSKPLRLLLFLLSEDSMLSLYPCTYMYMYIVHIHIVLVCTTFMPLASVLTHYSTRTCTYTIHVHVHVYIHAHVHVHAHVVS